MSVQQEHATSETATLTTTESGGVYQSLFDKINLTPVLPFRKSIHGKTAKRWPMPHPMSA